MPGLYALAILASFLGVGLIDWRWRLALFADLRRALIVVGATAALLLVWDLVGIALGIFVLGDGPALLGIEVAPHLPVEELGFVTFLAYVSLVAVAGVQRLLEARRAR